MPARSRATRNQDAATRSRQGQVIDLDPTDGLPVQKYALMKVSLNQDAASDQSAVNAKSTNSAEWAAQFNTPHFPWPEPPLPSFQKDLPIWTQEMIRRARSGNTNTKLSVWDRKNNCWMSAAEAEKKATPLKSLHLNNLDTSADTNGKLANGDADSPKSAEDSDAADSSNESNKSADEDEEDADEGAPFKTSATKRRKLANRHNGPDETRVIDVKKWVQLPSTIADRTPDRSFLAARRPGMAPLYNPEYAQKVFGQYHSSATLGGTTGYDLGEGGGLSNASAVMGGPGADANAGAPTPQRKNIPPRRKKKKLGGPGRKPKNWQANQAAQVDGAADVKAPALGTRQDIAGDAMEGVQAIDGASTEAAIKTEVEAGEVEGDDNNETGSEAEGSEEGEIDETGGAERVPEQDQEQSASVSAEDPVSLSNLMGDVDTTVPIIEPKTEPPSTTTSKAPTAAPGVTSTDVDTEMKEAEHEPNPNPELEPEPQPDAENHAAPLSAIMNETNETPSASTSAQPATPAPAPAPAPTAIEETVPNAIAVPGLGAENPEDAEEQQIIDENAEAITTAAADPAQEQIADVSAALQQAAEIPRIEHEKAQLAAEDIIRDAAGRIEKAQVEAEGEGEVDLLGAMDEAIDRGMSEGREA